MADINSEIVNLNDANAVTDLAIYYELTEHNYPDAVKYYEIAINLGSYRAMNNLGLYYGTREKDYIKAVHYFKMAIELGDTDAMNNLGGYYVNVEHNYPEGIHYYNMAIALGNSNAMNNLGIYYKYYEHNNSMAMKYFKMSANLDNSNGMKNLAKCYGDDKNYLEAVRWYECAMELGNYKLFDNYLELLEGTGDHQKIIDSYEKVVMDNILLPISKHDILNAALRSTKMIEKYGMFRDYLDEANLNSLIDHVAVGYT